MKIDLKNTRISSVITLLITNVISFIILVITKPTYIMKVTNRGKYVINYCLLLSYSLLYGILYSISIGVIVLLLSPPRDNNKKKQLKLSFSSHYNPSRYPSNINS